MSRALEKSRKLWRTDKSVLLESRNVSCQSVFHKHITSPSHCRASLAICHLHLYALIKGNIITDNQIFFYDTLFPAWERDTHTHTHGQHITSQVPCVGALLDANDWRSCQNALDASYLSLLPTWRWVWFYRLLSDALCPHHVPWEHCLMLRFLLNVLIKWWGGWKFHGEEPCSVLNMESGLWGMFHSF